MLKKFFAKFYLIFTAVIVLIGLAVGFKFYIFPFYQKTVSNLKTNIEDSSGQLQIRLAHLENLKSIKQEYDSIESAKIKKLDFILPKEKQIPELFLQIQTIVGESGLIMSSISASEVSNKTNGQQKVQAETETVASSNEKVNSSSLSDKVKTLEISLAISGGSYEKLKIVLDKIERSIRLLDIQSISFDNTFKSIDIIMNTYFLN